MAVVWNKMQSILDKRLSAWEEQCLKHCFEVPEGFSLPKTDEPLDNSQTFQDALCDQELDRELDSLKNKLIAVSKDSAVINQELRALEKQSLSNDHFAELITEAMESYSHDSFDRMIQEMATTVSELRTKMGNLKKRRLESTDCARTERLHTLCEDSSTLDLKNGFADAKLEDLQMFLAEIRKM